MRVRAVKDRNIVFFGSYGKDADGKALKSTVVMDVTKKTA